jgi:hypothetical protein
MRNAPFLLVFGLTLLSVGIAHSVLITIAVFVMAYMYLLPSMMTFKADGPFKWLILALNLVLGWTVVVWVLCLMSCINSQPRIIVNTARNPEPECDRLRSAHFERPKP